MAHRKPEQRETFRTCIRSSSGKEATWENEIGADLSDEKVLEDWRDESSSNGPFGEDRFGESRSVRRSSKGRQSEKIDSSPERDLSLCCDDQVSKVNQSKAEEGKEKGDLLTT